MTNTDSLINTRIRNKVSNPEQYLPSEFITSSSTTTDVLNNAVDEILDKTTIKRACCLARSTDTNVSVNVKLPVYPDIDFASLIDGSIQQKFGYINKTVSVPMSLCPSGYNVNNSTSDNSYNNCDTFYGLYCANARKVYGDKKTALGEDWDWNEFAEYAPDCACYNKVYPTIQTIIDNGQNVNIKPSCVYPSCVSTTTTGTPTVYEDPVSKDSSLSCSSVTICNSSVDFSNITAGNSVDISTIINQNCNSSTTGSSSGSSSTTGSGSSSTTGSGTGSDTGTGTDTSDENVLVESELSENTDYTVYIILIIIISLFVLFVIIIIIIGVKNSSQKGGFNTNYNNYNYKKYFKNN